MSTEFCRVRLKGWKHSAQVAECAEYTALTRCFLLLWGDLHLPAGFPAAAAASLQSCRSALPEQWVALVEPLSSAVLQQHCSKKPINDRKEREHRARYSPVERNLLNMAFLLLLEIAQCGMCPCHLPFHQWLFLQLPRFAETARWKQTWPHTHPEQLLWAVFTSTKCLTQVCSEDKRASDCLESKMGNGNRGRKSRMAVLEGSPMHRLVHGHWGTNTLDPKWCVLPAAWWEVQVELCNPGKMLQEADMMEKGACFAPADTCSINYFPKTILWCHTSWKPTFCGQPCPQCPYLWLEWIFAAEEIVV